MPNVKSKEELFSYITGLDSFAHNTAMLERIHNKGPSRNIATAPNTDSMPDAIKPLSYPFDYAWEKSKAMKASQPSTSSVTEAKNECVPVGAN